MSFLRKRESSQFVACVDPCFRRDDMGNRLTVLLDILSLSTAGAEILQKLVVIGVFSKQLEQ